MPENLRTVLITGANGGMGLAIARSLLSDPGTVVYLGVRSNDSNAALLVKKFPDRAHLLSLDVTSPKAWDDAITTILAPATGRIDVLVNNAGHHDDALLATMADDAWSSVLRSNLDGTFYGCRAVAKPMMSQRFGRIINISSLSALLAPAGQTNYAAAKAGVIAMSQSLSKELARASVTVNTVCPGYIETDALASMAPDQRKALARQVPMRRFGQPDEVAAAVRFLASREASYITGATLKIDGGIF